eukprot:15442252-Alexandrium_andersonii.AAC.1
MPQCLPILWSTTSGQKSQPLAESHDRPQHRSRHCPKYDLTQGAITTSQDHSASAVCCAIWHKTLRPPS